MDIDDDAFNMLTYDEAGVENIVDGHNEFTRFDDEQEKEHRSINEGLISVHEDEARTSLLPNVMDDSFNWYMNIGIDEHLAKRRRIELDRNIDLTITKIVETRRRKSTLSLKPNKTTTETDTMATNVEPSNLLKYPPMNGLAWFGLNSISGALRRYVSERRHKPLLSIKTKEVLIDNDGISQILSELRLKRMAPLNNELHDEYSCSFSFSEFLQTNELWVDKYAPKNFLDLVSDNESNRLLMLWLKLWDDVVFKTKLDYDSLNEKDRSIIEMESKKGVLMPKLKIAVLAGPSGSGKTVLANLACKISGYQPFVINLSEIHNASELEAKLENVSNSTSINFLFKNQGQKILPNCFIIEGIESSTADIINCLSRYSNRSGKGIQKRPIICSCNNYYAQNLKELRNYGFHIKVTCDENRVLEKIKMICNSERIAVDKSFLNDFVRLHGNDIRLCLNTLQFYFSNKSLEGFSISKDSTDEAGSISIFRALSKVIALNEHIKKGTPLKPSERSRNLIAMLSKLGDDSRFMQLLFNNLPIHLKLSHTQYRRISEHFVLFDLNWKSILTNQNFILSRYQPYIIVSIHLICASFLSRRLAFNLTLDHGEKIRECKEIIGALKRGNSMKFLHSSIILSTIPYLHYILRPNIHLSSTQIENAKEMLALNDLIQKMVSLGVTYAYRNDEKAVALSFICSPATGNFPCAISCFHKSGECEKWLADPLKKLISHQIYSFTARKASSIPLNTSKEKNSDGDHLVSNSFANIPTKSNTNNKNIDTGPHPERLSGFTFKYNQGSSQAIRRNIKIGAIFK